MSDSVDRGKVDLEPPGRGGKGSQGIVAVVEEVGIVTNWGRRPMLRQKGCCWDETREPEAEGVSER